MSDIHDSVGKIAGEVWRHLDKHGETSAMKLKAALEINNSLLYMAIGWLARENKLAVQETDRGFKISLKK